MAKTTQMSNDFLKLFFNATPWANIADNATASPRGNLYVTLNVADPGVAGDITTNETTYPGYIRQAVLRTSVGWVVTGNTCSPANNIVFPGSSGATPTCGYFGIGDLASGGGRRFYNGQVLPPIVVGTGVQTLTTGSLITES